MSAEEWDPRLRWLVDTYVLPGIAKDHRQEQTWSVLQERVRLGDVSLLVPSVVLAEFDRQRHGFWTNAGEASRWC
jgi:hypothetical protein